MRSNAISLVLAASIALGASAAMADTITLRSTGGGVTDSEDIYPYYFNLASTNGSVTTVAMSCLNFNREVGFGETWLVDPYVVSAISGTLDGQSAISFLADAWLFNQYGSGWVAGVGVVTDAEIQFAIWDIMDPSQVATRAGFDANAKALAAMALQNASSLPASYFTHDLVYIPDAADQAAWTYGEPQIFMTQIPSVPEPTSIGLVTIGCGAFWFLRLNNRRRRIVESF